ncbi:MAG: outer membrane lipid asymmetry maintenance protein MlaD [Alphaproteobacteria bacterium]|nr:outer membrane lipid asymmetry maintenance protein MlaD [Alphaproteobacteria bacterium]
MKKNYFESILGFLTLVISLSFLFKFVNVNTNNNETYQLKAKFLKAGGISSGNDVKMRGVKIGVVSDVYLDKDYFAVVDFQVYKQISVPKQSIVKIASDGILGNKYLSITPGGNDLKEVLSNNQEIQDVEDFESIEDQVSKIIFLATQ